jgi:hypothetical protein
MTMIGAIKCRDGVVLLADGQETVSDYAKWAVNKIKSVELNGKARIVMTGSGDAASIDMIWEKVSELWGSSGSGNLVSWRADFENKSPKEWRKRIVSIVRSITKKSILPWGRNHQGVGLIWMIQDIAEPINGKPLGYELSCELFRTSDLSENNIRDFYFDGNPVLLARYISDLYLKNFMWGIEEARAFAAYLLWETKEYDPTVGKQSDIITFRLDGTVSRMSYEESSYWEDHFRVLKREMAILPLLSCATTITRQLYETGEHMGRLKIAIRTLVLEQEKMRQKKRTSGRIDTILIPRIRAHAQLFQRKRTERLGLTPLAPQTSKDQQ